MNRRGFFSAIASAALAGIVIPRELISIQSIWPPSITDDVFDLYSIILRQGFQASFLFEATGPDQRRWRSLYGR
jgi:hypothetical protein